MNRLILASASPRRQQLMALLGVPFVVKPGSLDEKRLILSGPPSRQVMDSARAKAEAAAEADRDSWILAADTVVCIDGQILGKPEGREEARHMLSRISSRRHVVATGVCLCHYGQESPEAICEETAVWMTALTAAQIEAYIDTGEPMDKAGAYGIQGFGGALIPRIEGCFFNVMGLPLYRTAKLLEEAGIGPGAAYWRGESHA